MVFFSCAVLAWFGINEHQRARSFFKCLEKLHRSYFFLKTWCFLYPCTSILDIWKHVASGESWMCPLFVEYALLLWDGLMAACGGEFAHLPRVSNLVLGLSFTMVFPHESNFPKHTTPDEGKFCPISQEEGCVCLCDWSGIVWLCGTTVVSDLALVLWMAGQKGWSIYTAGLGLHYKWNFCKGWLLL